MTVEAHTGAVVLAAGQSRRMGSPKMVLPWGDHTVIEQVAGTLIAAGVGQIVVVTGGARDRVEAALSGYPVELVHNPDYARAEMLSSLQAGIRQLNPGIEACLIVLGDQPGIEVNVIRAVMDRFHKSKNKAKLIVPSYKMRRGHPWLAARSLWNELLAMQPGQTLRDFLHAHSGEITYVEVDSPSILKDMDTPEDYQAQRPIHPER